MRADARNPQWLHRGLLVCFWSAALGVAVLSLMPTNYLPAQVFSLWDKAQHALAFTALASLGLLAYPRQPPRPGASARKFPWVGCCVTLPFVYTP